MRRGREKDGQISKVRGAGGGFGKYHWSERWKLYLQCFLFKGGESEEVSGNGTYVVNLMPVGRSILLMMN